MECKFLNHGISVSYSGVLKPCCDWRTDPTWDQANNISVVSDLSNWMKTAPDLLQAKEQLANNQWPDRCANCKNIEGSGRFDSVRGYGNSAYSDLSGDDITLEIRPGTTCNFACQTCWPHASSRVVNFYKQADISVPFSKINSFNNFDMLLPLAKNIKQANILGGEPFYDKSCRQFLDWAKHHLSPATKISLFTNGSIVDKDLLENSAFDINVVFSLDAIDKESEYIRYGTDWKTVKENYLYCKDLKHIDLGVNITVSIYNILYLAKLIDFLLQDPPRTITLTCATQEHFKYTLIPHAVRDAIIKDLSATSIKILKHQGVSKDQKDNVVNALRSCINELKSQEFNSKGLEQFKDFVKSMDRVKQIQIDDYCPELSSLL